MSAREPKNQYGQRMRRKGIKTRQSLLQATAALMEKRSVRELKVTEITAAVGTSVSTFYIYFDDVIDAVLALTEEVEQITPEMEAFIDRDWGEDDAFANAHALVQAYVNFWDQHHAILRVRNLAAEEGDKRFREARHRSTERLLKLLQQKIEAGSPALDAASLATIVMSILERIPAITRVPSPQRRSRPRMIDAAAYTIALLVNPASRVPAAHRPGPEAGEEGEPAGAEAPVFEVSAPARRPQPARAAGADDMADG